MTDGASTEAAGATAGGQAVPMPNAAAKPAAVPPAAMPHANPKTPPNARFLMRTVPKATAAERLMREEGMARALRLGAKPYRDAEGKGRHIPFKEADLAPVEPWLRDPKAKRGYRRTQELRKSAGQLIGQPGDKIEIAKRLGELHWEQGSDIEGAARRGLYDAIWSREHVYDTFTVPRRYGRTLFDTGRIAAVAEEEGRKIQAEDPKARGGFWVRDRNDFGLLYVVPNPDPVEETAEEEIGGREGEVVLVGDADLSSLQPHPVATEVNEPDADSPIRDDDKSEALAGVQGDIMGLAREGTEAKRVRDFYRQQVQAASADFMKQYLAGGLDANAAAQAAYIERNELIKKARESGTALAYQIAESMKKRPPPFEQLEGRYAAKLFDKPFEQLAKADKIGVWEEIIRAAGRDRGTVSKAIDGLGKAGRALWVLSAAISAYNVLTADDRVKALAKESVTLGAGLAGSALGGVAGAAALGFLVGGPVGAAIGVLAGGFAAAMGADIAFDALFEHN